MKETEIFAKLEEIFEDVFDEKITLTADTTANDVDDEFGIKFTMKEVSSMKNVGEMVDIIKQRA